MTHTHTTTHSDLEGLAVQLNPVLIQTFTPCVNPDLPCRLYVPRNKANPGGLSHSGNEIRYNAPNVSQLCPTSTELCRLPAEQTGKAGASVELQGLQKHIFVSYRNNRTFCWWHMDWTWIRFIKIIWSHVSVNYTSIFMLNTIFVSSIPILTIEAV